MISDVSRYRVNESRRCLTKNLPACTANRLVARLCGPGCASFFDSFSHHDICSAGHYFDYVVPLSRFSSK